MSTLRAAQYAQSGGRAVRINNTWYATISPLAAPTAFAIEHKLGIAHSCKKNHGDGVVAATMFTNDEGKAAVVSGIVTSDWDDHDITRLEDLDFIPVEEATQEMHVAIDVLFGEDAPKYRRNLLVCV